MKRGQAEFIQDIFSSEIPATYERVNHFITFWNDIIWRRRAARIAAAAGGNRWVDMCTGTGEMAVCISRLAPRGTEVYAVDFSSAMIAVARKKQEADKIKFIVSDAGALAFPDNSFDLVTISFATRNINLSRDALTETFAEFCRILKPGGLFINLETSQPSSSLTRRLFHAYVKLFVKPVGGIISGSGRGYSYLKDSIPRFYKPEELSGIMGEAGFINVTYRKMLFGAAAIHQGSKA